MGSGVVICQDLADIAGMFDSQNIMKGLKPVSVQKEEREKANEGKEDPDELVKIFKIPSEHFAEFKEIDDRNLELFEFLAF